MKEIKRTEAGMLENLKVALFNVVRVWSYQQNNLITSEKTLLTISQILLDIENLTDDIKDKL